MTEPVVCGECSPFSDYLSLAVGNKSETRMLARVQDAGVMHDMLLGMHAQCALLCSLKKFITKRELFRHSRKSCKSNGQILHESGRNAQMQALQLRSWATQGCNYDLWLKFDRPHSYFTQLLPFS